MNGYERALKTLRFEPTDCVPTWDGWIVSAGFFDYMTGKRFWDNPRAVAMEAYRKMEVDIIAECMYLPESQEDWRAYTDETIVGADKFRSPEDVVAYVESLPDPATLERDFDFDRRMEETRKHYVDLQDEIGPDIFCLPQCKSAKFTWFEDFGYQSYMEAFALYPDAIRALMDHSAEQGRLLNTVRAALVNDGVLPPFFFMGQDICANSGPIVSPDTLRKLYFPSLKRSFEPLVEIGAEVIWHSDGYIIPILDDLISSGISGFQGFQEHTGFDVADIAAKRVRDGRKPILMAGLGVDRVLPFGTVEDVKRDVARIIDTAGPGGGLVIGTANTPGPDCKNKNLETLYRYVHEYGMGRRGISRRA